MILPGGVGHGALVPEVNHVRFDLVCSYIYIGNIDSVLATNSYGKPPLEELKLLTVVVYGPLGSTASALGREEEMDCIPEVEFV